MNLQAALAIGNWDQQFSLQSASAKALDAPKQSAA